MGAKPLKKEDVALLISEASKQQTEAILRKLDERFDNFESKYIECEERLSEHDKKINLLENKVNDLEQKDKLNNLRFYGLPEDSGEGRPLKEVLIQFCHKKLDVLINPADISQCYRLSKKLATGHPRVVLVKFVYNEIKSKVFSNKKLLKKSPFRLAEDLTHTNFKLYRDCVEKFGLSSTWTVNGRILVVDSDGQKKVMSRETLETTEHEPRSPSSNITSRKR